MAKNIKILEKAIKEVEELIMKIEFSEILLNKNVSIIFD